jgi:hypothetical protein
MDIRPEQPFTFDTIGDVPVDEYSALEQQVAAGQQFDGTAGKGLFQWTDNRGRTFVRMTLIMGSESKNYSVDIVDPQNRRTPIETKTATTAQNVLIFGRIVLVPSEHIEIITSGATSAMYAELLTEE